MRRLQLVATTCLVVFLSNPTLAIAQSKKRPVPKPAIASPTVAPPAVAPPTDARETDNYILGAGDTVKIDVFNVPEISNSQTIAPDGTVNMSLIGAVSVEGLTLTDAAKRLGEKLAPYLVRRIVNVTLVEARPLNIAVVGEVNRPGTRLLAYSRATTGAGRDAQTATIAKALEVAGGVTQLADVGNIQVSRQDKNGQRRTIKIDLLALLNKGDMSQNIRVLDGDSILVPKLATPGTSQPREVTNSSFSGDSFSIQIAVAGEVNRTGPQILAYSRNGGQTGANGQAQPNQLPTLTRALQVAGGISQQADIRNVQISRLGENGQRSTFTVNLWNLIDKGDLNQDIALVDGDSIFVPKAASTNSSEIGQVAKATFSPDRISVQVIGEVTKPGTVELRPNTPFTQAIAAAGGITSSGDWKSVELYRLNPDGSLTQRKLAADLNLAVSEENNPGLRDRDVIVVRQTFTSGVLNTASSIFGGIFTPLTLFTNIFRR